MTLVCMVYKCLVWCLDSMTEGSLVRAQDCSAYAYSPLDSLQSPAQQGSISVILTIAVHHIILYGDNFH